MLAALLPASLRNGNRERCSSSRLDLSRLDDRTEDREWGFKAIPQPGKPGRINYSRAKVLGGCGNHNDCAFLIPPDSDFDGWANRGAAGWTSNDVRRYLDLIEERLHVELDPPVNPISQIMMDAGVELGIPPVRFRRNIREGVGPFPLNSEGALRQSSFVAYLHPLAKLPANLRILTETMATQLIVENGEAVGCSTSQDDIRAKREVILAAGSVQTPQLMMLSGLGPEEHLREHGIPILQDLKGVRQHLLHHPDAPVIFSLKKPVPPWWKQQCCFI